MAAINLESSNPLKEIVQALMLIDLPTYGDVNRAKMKVAANYELTKIPSNSELIRILTPTQRIKLLPLLRRKKTRTISGVTVIAVMTKPYPCPQKEPCSYCPGGPRFGVPQSYTGYEPAAMRGMQNNYSPFKQVKSRIQQLTSIGHNVDKIELIIMGGTFPATRLRYQTSFIKSCLDAITSKTSANLEQAKKNAEASRIRNVGITVETRPDWAKEKQVDQMLRMGVTRVELGVQNPNDMIYRAVGRTHTVQDVIDATRILKDAGLKIVYHLMPGLPTSNQKKDTQAFKQILTNPNFKPDMIKIYPCLVLKGTKAYELYRKGEYTPYTTEQATNLIAEIKKHIPPWIRIMRVQRDIPAQLIEAGVNRSNLRQLALHKLQQKGLRCRCIRCREVGHRQAIDMIKPDPDKIRILTTKYQASEGEETFISAEDTENDILLGYLRIRVPSPKAHLPEINAQPCTIVRELHIYGPLVPVGKHHTRAWQHKGYGTILLNEAERITREHYGYKKIAVISALGTKQYYRRHGYKPDGVYMSKTLEK